MRKGRAQDFDCNKTILYDPVVVDTCHHTLGKTQECKLWTSISDESVLAHYCDKRAT